MLYASCTMPILPPTIATIDLCPIETAQDIDISFVTLHELVLAVNTGKRQFDADTVQTLQWAVMTVSASAGRHDAQHLHDIHYALTSDSPIDFAAVARLALTFVDEMKPLIEVRIARAAAMMAKYC